VRTLDALLVFLKGKNCGLKGEARLP